MKDEMVKLKNLPFENLAKYPLTTEADAGVPVDFVQYIGERCL